jgi:sugar O-acyltransferase (sialic acid O-acetyltransferase NeuD family)
MSTVTDEIAEVVFWGATGQAKVLRELIGPHGPQLVALFDRDSTRPSPFADVPIYYGRPGFEAWLKARGSSSGLGCLVAVGGDRGRDRCEIQQYLVGFGLYPLTVRHPTAFVAANSSLASGSQILAHTAVCVEATLGEACIINTGASVDHECHLGDGVHIGPGARLAGCVKIERYVFVGTGAVVLPRIRIGEGAIIGAGSVVVKDVEAHTVVAGNPARVLRKL